MPVMGEMKENAEVSREEEGITDTPEGEEDVVSEEVKVLFQKAYKHMYEGGQMDELITMINDGGEIIPLVSGMIVAILNSFIKDGGVEDMRVLFNLGVLLMGDILDTLNQSGIDVNSQVDEQGSQTLISTVVTKVLTANPEFAEMVKNDPATQEFAQAQAGQGDAMAGAKQGVAAGVMGGM